MKSIIKYFLLGIFLSFHISMYGQFNTLTPILQKKAENPKITEKVKEENNPKPKKEKKFWKDVFNMTTKADLKSQLDSLKAMIKENSASNSKKENLKKSQDSLIIATKSKIINDFQNNIKDPFGQTSSSKTRTNVAKEVQGAYEFVDEPQEVNFSKIVMPLRRKISITSPYGTRTHPIFGTSKFHNGIDLAAHYENVYSVLDGVVTETGKGNKGGGNYIKIKHFNRFETAYLHLSEIYYRVGERVKAGFIIAKSGNSGNSTGPHLHFSVKEFGKSINPYHFLNDLIKVNQLIATYYAK